MAIRWNPSWCIADWSASELLGFPSTTSGAVRGALSWHPLVLLTNLLCFQLNLTILRQTGGLGISIAGGKGSTPYKGNDEVRGGWGVCRVSKGWSGVGPTVPSGQPAAWFSLGRWLQWLLFSPTWGAEILLGYLGLTNAPACLSPMNSLVI